MKENREGEENKSEIFLAYVWLKSSNNNNNPSSFGIILYFPFSTSLSFSNLFTTPSSPPSSQNTTHISPITLSISLSTVRYISNNFFLFIYHPKAAEKNNTEKCELCKGEGEKLKKKPTTTHLLTTNPTNWPSEFYSHSNSVKNVYFPHTFPILCVFFIHTHHTHIHKHIHTHK